MLIAHDLGTTGDKASLHDETGRLIASTTASYPARFAAGGAAEQDPADWQRAVVDATRRLLAQTGVDPASVTGLVVSGQMMGAVLLDADYRPVRPAIIWADTRAVAQTEQLVARVGEESAYRVTGHRLNPTYTLEKLMWVRDNEPDVWARVRHACVAKDVVVHWLTGRLATERSDASATNAYDQQAGRWSDEILQAAGVDPRILPEIVESTDVIGTLTEEAASATGLRRGTRVVMGGGDGPMAAVGAGVVAPEDGAYVCLGTSSWVSVATGAPVLDPQMRTFTFNHIVPGMFAPTATMQAAGASVQWLSEILSGGEDGASLDRLVREADGADAAQGGLFFLPFLLGERSPRWDPHARGAFLGIERHHTRAHMMRAVLEGVSYNLLQCIDAFRECGVAIDRIDAVGGGAQSDAWLQIMADMWGVTVRRRTIVEEANSLGAAITGAVGLGLVDGFGAARELSEVTAEFAPDPSRTAVYRERLPLFDEAYASLAPWFRRSAEARA
ncbi:xylulokinase [Microbacterium karelineae]|uniref:xylulokinase n=1 Tax=Microbacterium karelineae TaxID=2654283 RepID=UPI0012EA7329|nr:xylulokinase [Microbacterium karelineae]